MCFKIHKKMLISCAFKAHETIYISDVLKYIINIHISYAFLKYIKQNMHLKYI